MSGARRPVLCVVHHDPADVSLVGAHLRARGVEALVRQPNAGDPLPAPEEVAAAVVFGGAMSANDDHDPAIRAELDWVRAALGRGMGLFGICLGGQMIARALGARVAPHPTGLWELGYRPLAPTPDGAETFAAARAFYHWHGEGFTLPPGAVRLAGGALFAEQAYRWGRNVWGVQFHPEVARDRLDVWQGQDMSVPGADTASRQNRDDARLRPAAEAWLSGFLDRWLAAEGLG
jgi:GMP synthase (glutamine-hydrolysing)